MPVDNDRRAHYAQQYRPPRLGPFLDPESLKRRNYTCDSSSLSPSTDLPGSSESIFNAIKVTSPEGSTPVSGTAYNMGPVMEEGLAANIAMFIPSTSSNDDHPSAERYSAGKERRRVDTVWWRNQMLSDQSSHYTPHLGAGPFTETILTADAAWNLHRKAISLDTVGGNQHVPRWPENLGSAVSTFRPQYPPPERQPTPPGLPSFNTPEAMYYSAQFLVGQNGGRHMCGVSQHTQSYGDALLRFFNLSPSNETAPGGLSVAGIGRAEDGTIVQGRFPYRQSGHGINLARQLNDHPFHQSNLPIAENETEQLRQVMGTEGTSTKSPVYPSRRRIRIYTPPSIGRLWPFSDSTSGSAIPPRPRKQGRAITLFSLQRNAPTQNGSTSAPSTVESSVHDVGVIGNQISPTSPLQSVHTQAIPGDLADEELPETGYSNFDLLSWLPAQFCLCCSGRRISKNRHSMEPLEVVTTGETYLTAREDQHRRKWGSSWISCWSSLVCPGALLSGQSAR